MSRWWHSPRAEPAPRVALLDALAPPPSDWPLLLRIAAEAVILQDQAESVMAAIQRREPLGFVAPIGGPLSRRMFALRDTLPRFCLVPDEERLRHQLDVVLHTHAMVLATAMDLLACEWRSPRLGAQLDAMDGLGAPARLLDQAYAELAAGAVATVA